MRLHGIRLGLGIALCVVFSAAAFAQVYGTGTGTGTTTGTYSPPKGGYSSATGAAIGGAAAAGVVIAYLALHKTTLVGCVEQSSEGIKMMNEKDKKTYAIDAKGQDLKTGTKVELKGKTTKDTSGNKVLHVKAFKEMGPCS